MASSKGTVILLLFFLFILFYRLYYIILDDFQQQSGLLSENSLSIYPPEHRRGQKTVWRSAATVQRLCAGAA